METPRIKLELSCSVLGSCLAIALLIATAGRAEASGPLDMDRMNDDPITHAAAPSLDNIQKLAPSIATSGTGDAGPALSHSPVSEMALSGHGIGCVPTSPCAAVLPNSDHSPQILPRSLALLSEKHGRRRAIN